MNEILRRCCIDKFTPAEKAIYDAMGVVEMAGADVRLTDAVVLLQAARDAVADYVDGIEKRRRVKENDGLEMEVECSVPSCSKPARHFGLCAEHGELTVPTALLLSAQDAQAILRGDTRSVREKLERIANFAFGGVPR